CAGCTTLDVGRYGVSVENNAALKKLSGQKVTVGAFTAIEPGKNEIPCRAVGPIKTPDRRRASWWSSRRAATGNSPRWVDSLPEDSYVIHACAPADVARARSRGRARAHGWSGYDSSKVLTLTGTVREAGYEHPHGFVKLQTPAN